MTVEGRWLNKSVRDAVLVGLLRHLNSGQPEERKLMMADVSNVILAAGELDDKGIETHLGVTEGKEKNHFLVKGTQRLGLV